MTPVLAYAAVSALITAMLTRARSARGPSRCVYRDPDPVEAASVPFAFGDPCPAWPIAASKNRRWQEVAYRDVHGQFHGNAARRFLADRAGGQRYHVGIDLYANPGDVVVAPEAGEIVNLLPYHLGTWAVYLQTDSGLLLNLAEVAHRSWQPFGVQKGARVQKGQPIARVGVMDGGSHMLHFETYRAGIDQNQRWWKGQPMPSHLLNPTQYLLRARAARASAAVA